MSIRRVALLAAGLVFGAGVWLLVVALLKTPRTLGDDTALGHH